MIASNAASSSLKDAGRIDKIRSRFKTKDVGTGKGSNDKMVRLEREKIRMPQSGSLLQEETLHRRDEPLQVARATMEKGK